MSIFHRLADLLMCAVMAVTGFLFTGQMPQGKISAPATGPLTQYVNPFVGTGAIPWAGGMTSPGAAAPFGAVRLSPDTCWPFGLNIDRVGTGGYWRGKTHTYGFSHTRVSGAGLIEGGNFRVTPGLGNADPLKRLRRPLLFAHARETAVPGYYAVWLPEAACLAELTATEHTGVHRYTFTSGKDAHLFFDATSMLNYDNRAQNGYIKVIDENTLEGSFNNRIFFYAEFDTPFKATLWKDGALLTGASEAESARAGEGQAADVGADLNFGDVKDKPVTMRLGMSYVSIAGAKANLFAESAGTAFDDIYAATRDGWETRLASVKITTSDSNIKKIFYTAMYHAMLHPTNVTDVTGTYAGFGNTTGTAAGFTYRGDLSLWDTFRTTHPLYCLIAPDIQKDSAQSLLVMARLHGGFPRWPKTTSEGGSMFGNPAHQVIAETYLKGLMNDADAAEALRIMKDTVYGTIPAGKPMRGRDYFSEYNTLGYVPAELSDISVSRTLEYAWADYSSYLLAEALGTGYEADAAAFYGLSQNFKNVFDPSTKYFRPKSAAGQWQRSVPWITTYYDEILPVKYADGFSEGSAKHYRWHAIQEPQWLVESMGGSAAFVKELDKFMKGASLTRAALNPGDGWWVGNQHNYHAPYMFNEAGRPDLMQKWVRWTLDNRFADSPDGLDGNDDLGALSAWYIFGALGFYPVAGTDQYWLGSPAVDEAKLQLEGGVLTVKAINQGPKNVYVKSVTFNGTALNPSKTFAHDLIKDGGTLEFTMAAKP